MQICVICQSCKITVFSIRRHRHFSCKSRQLNLYWHGLGEVQATLDAS